MSEEVDLVHAMEFQKFLLENRDDAIEHFKRDRRQASSTRNGVHGNRTSFSIVRGIEGDQEEIEVIPNFLDLAISDTKKGFLDLPDSMRRSLVPIVKVYKTFVDREGQQVDLRIKTDPNNNGVSRVELEQIDYIRRGGNPAEVDTNIEFNIKLSARELGFYFEKQYPTSEQGRDDEFTRDRESKGVAWIDLIKIDPGRELQVGEAGNDELVINELNARMKVILGYARPTIPPSGMHEGEWEIWADRIAAQQEVFYLNIFKHQFDFKESGEVGLSVDFIASGSGRMLSPQADLLLGPRMKRRAKSLAKQIRAAKDLKKRVGAASNQDLVNETWADIRELTGWNVTGNGLRTNEETTATMVECLDEIRSGAENRISSLEAQLERYNNYARRRLINQLDLYNAQAQSQVPPGADILMQTKRDRGNQRIMWHNRRAANDPDRPNDAWSSFISATTQDRRFDMPYVLLGDIVEAALELVAENGLLGEDRNINDPSDIEWSHYKVDAGDINSPVRQNAHTTTFGRNSPDDPRRVKTIEEYGGIFLSNVIFEDIDRYRNANVPLIYLPISFDLFKNWWSTTTDSKTSFYIRDFIISLFTQFLPGYVFSEDMYEEGDRDNLEVPAFSITNLVVNYNDLFDAISNERGSGYGFWREASGIIDRERYETMVKDASASSLMNETGNIMVIQQVKKSSAVNTKTVPNLLWGQSTRGILESVQFQREDIPGYAEARLMADRASTANNMMLNEKYNTTLEMLGNTAFLPGSQLFLDPKPLDLGFSSEPGSYARSLGLGGLYVVNYTEHSLDFIKKSWTTKLDTKWESFGDGQAGDNSITASDALCIDEIRREFTRFRNARESGLKQRQRGAVDLRMAAEMEIARLRSAGLLSPAQIEDMEAQLYEQIDADLREVGEEINALPDFIIPEEPEESQ